MTMPVRIKAAITSSPSPPYIKQSYHSSCVDFVHQKMEPSPQKETSSLQPHAPIVRTAAKALADKNIPLVEYGSQVEWRCGYPLVLLVRDEIFYSAIQSLGSTDVLVLAC